MGKIQNFYAKKYHVLLIKFKKNTLQQNNKKELQDEHLNNKSYLYFSDFFNLFAITHKVALTLITKKENKEFLLAQRKEDVEEWVKLILYFPKKKS